MEQRRLSAAELVEVIRAKTSYSAMMSKYCLSEKQLDGVFRKLIEKGVIRSEELPERQDGSPKALAGNSPPVKDQVRTEKATELELDAVQLQHLLGGAWDKVSADFVRKLLKAVKKNNQAVIGQALGKLAGSGEQMIEV